MGDIAKIIYQFIYYFFQEHEDVDANSTNDIEDRHASNVSISWPMNKMGT